MNLKEARLENQVLKKKLEKLRKESQSPRKKDTLKAENILLYKQIGQLEGALTKANTEAENASKRDSVSKRQI